jgi:hypothetical protein
LDQTVFDLKDFLKVMEVRSKGVISLEGKRSLQNFFQWENLENKK